MASEDQLREPIDRETTNIANDSIGDTEVDAKLTESHQEQYAELTQLDVKLMRINAEAQKRVRDSRLEMIRIAGPVEAATHERPRPRRRIPRQFWDVRL